jgi:hypothetical protein
MGHGTGLCYFIVFCRVAIVPLAAFVYITHNQFVLTLKENKYTHLKANVVVKNDNENKKCL